ncbi:glycosyltransferase [Bacillus sp. Gen3]|nr:glycosyltransferase [Bacillus sp. Gen3]
MRVLQINSVCGIGSTGRIATDMDKVLKSLGHESYIAYGRDKPLHCENTIKIGTKLDNYVHLAKTRIFDQHGFGSKLSTLKFIKKVKQLNPDIIHLHNLHGYYLNIEILFRFLKEFNKTIIWTLHDCWTFTGHCASFDYLQCDKWKTGCNKCPQKTEYPSSLLIDQSESNFHKKKEIFTGVKNLIIVTPSEWLKQKVKQSFFCEYPVIVINNGIDLDTFQPQKNAFREKFDLCNKFIILGVANVWGMKKGYQYFIDLSARLQPNEVIVMVGLTKKQIRNLPHNIIGIEKTNNVKELAEIYTASDVFINPTLEDNFPTTNLESLACGTPVITFNTGGSVESIDTSSGIIVEKGNIDLLTAAIKKIKNYSSIHCLNRSKRYDKEKKYKEYLETYRNLLEISR